MTAYSFRYTDSAADALLFARNASSVITLTFDRAEIEANRTSTAMNRLLAISRSEVAVRTLPNSAVLQLRGYDTDPRALFKISPCRRFFRQLAYTWDGWFHFLEKDRGSISLLLSLLVELDVQHKPDGTVSYRLHDFGELKAAMQRLFYLMDTLYDRYQLDDEHCRATTEKVYRAVERMLGAPGLRQVL